MQKDSQATQLAIRPTRLTLYLRRCLPWQLYRFIVINLRMTAMILKSHHTRIARGKYARPVPAPPAPAVMKS